ncbi:MAG: hypothetical protein ABEJ30_07795 [Halorientalis sp.]
MDIDEKRVYGEKTGATEVYVASGAGLAVVSVSADIVGEFALARRCTARDVAAGPEHLAVATDADVLVSESGGYVETDFGPAVAVGFDGARLLAAGPEGGVAAREDGAWTALGAADEVRAIDGGLVAASDGVYWATDGQEAAGLSDVRDVAAADPLAATGDGLYELGPGWREVRPEAFTAVASERERAHAATAAGLFERRDGEWQPRPLPVEDGVVDIAHGAGTYAVTGDGTVLVDAGDGWRTRSLGLPAVAGLAVAP